MNTRYLQFFFGSEMDRDPVIAIYGFVPVLQKISGYQFIVPMRHYDVEPERYAFRWMPEEKNLTLYVEGPPHPDAWYYDPSQRVAVARLANNAWQTNFSKAILSWDRTNWLVGTSTDRVYTHTVWGWYHA